MKAPWRMMPEDSPTPSPHIQPYVPPLSSSVVSRKPALVMALPSSPSPRVHSRLLLRCFPCTPARKKIARRLLITLVVIGILLAFFIAFGSTLLKWSQVLLAYIEEIGVYTCVRVRECLRVLIVCTLPSLREPPLALHSFFNFFDSLFQGCMDTF